MKRTTKRGFAEQSVGEPNLPIESSAVEVQVVGHGDIVPMSNDEARECVNIVRDGFDTAREQLLQLYERQGYKALGYDNFAACLQTEFPDLVGASVDTKYCYKLVKTAKVERALRQGIPSLSVKQLPLTHLLPLVNLDPDQQCEVYLTAANRAANAPKRGLTAERIKEVLQEKYPQVAMQPRGGLANANAHQTHLTPQHIVERVVECLGTINLDPCSEAETKNNPNIPAQIHYTQRHNGLEQRWLGKIYCNFPYSDRETPMLRWVRHFLTQMELGGIVEAILLVPAYSDTRWWSELLEAPHYPPICLIKGRLTFGGNDGPARFPNALMYYGADPGHFYQCFADIGAVVQEVHPEMIGV